MTRLMLELQNLMTIIIKKKQVALDCHTIPPFSQRLSRTQSYNNTYISSTTIQKSYYVLANYEIANFFISLWKNILWRNGVRFHLHTELSSKKSKLLFDINSDIMTSNKFSIIR